jgi:hypothetical protein
LGKAYLGAADAEKTSLLTLYRGLRSVDLGIVRIRFYGKSYDISGMAVAALLLVLNAATVPYALAGLYFSLIFSPAPSTYPAKPGFP